MRSRASVATSAGTSRSRPGGAITSRAPASSGRKNSQIDASNAAEVFCSTASCASSGNARVIHAMWFASEPCVTTTPFGRPVEPDVYST